MIKLISPGWCIFRGLLEGDMIWSLVALNTHIQGVCVHSHASTYVYACVQVYVLMCICVNFGWELQRIVEISIIGSDWRTE